jgi:hypothetical protein
LKEAFSVIKKARFKIMIKRVFERSDLRKVFSKWKN